MTTQPTSIDEIVEEFASGEKTYQMRIETKNTGSIVHDTHIEYVFLNDVNVQDWLRSKLTTLVEQARGQSRLDTLQEIFVKYGYDFTDEGVKRAMESDRTISSDKK